MRRTLRVPFVWILAATLIGSTLTLAVARAAPGHRRLSTLQTATTPRVIATTRVCNKPTGVDVNPLTNRVYVTNLFDNTFSMIEGKTNQVVAIVTVGAGPAFVAPDPQFERF
jgi:YVTN family beta-propeller protein